MCNAQPAEKSARTLTHLEVGKAVDAICQAESILALLRTAFNGEERLADHVLWNACGAAQEALGRITRIVTDGRANSPDDEGVQS